MSLSLSELLVPRARRTTEIDIPELGGHVRVRALRFSEFSKLWAAISKLDEKKDGEELIALQLIACVVNDDGSPVFTSKEDVYKFIEQCTDASVVARIIKAGNDMNKVGPLAMEAAEKN